MLFSFFLTRTILDENGSEMEVKPKRQAFQVNVPLPIQTNPVECDDMAP